MMFFRMKIILGKNEKINTLDDIFTKRKTQSSLNLPSREKLQQSLQSNMDVEAVELFNKLLRYNQDLEGSNCDNLKTYVDNTTVFWFELIKEKLKMEMQESLKLIQWPYISTNQEVLKTVPPPDLMSKFQVLFQCLKNLKIPAKKLEEASNAVDHVVLSRFPPLSLAIQELMNPLQKRFLYHFSGNRPTNRRDKPEWYLRQIIQWIEDHTKFIEASVQPLYEPNDALAEFSRGLVQLAVEKLVKDTSVILEDDVILAHTIGEVLSFESELRTSTNYPSSQPSALLVLTQPQFFSRWIALERVFAVEKMDVILGSEKAWICVSVGDGSETEDEFLELQLELLDEFRIRLLQLARQDKFNEFFLNRSSPNICPILNTLAAVVNVLDDWTDLPFFVQLHSFKIQVENVERMAAEAISNEEVSLPWLRTQAHTKDEAGSVFDNIIELLKRMQEDLLSRVVEAVVLEVKAKSQPYRLDKWASLPNPDEFIQPSLSPSGSAMLQAVAIGLLWLKDSLASTLFTEAWQKLAAEINEFLLEELILQRQFNEGGAAQLCFDIQQNLIPLFSQYTPKPDNHFKELKDACILLRLPQPITVLLLDTLAATVQESDIAVGKRYMEEPLPTRLTHRIGMINDRLRIASYMNPYGFNISYPNAYSRIEIELLNWMSKKLNFTYDVVTPKEFQLGLPLPNGSWSGVLGLLQIDMTTSFGLATHAKSLIVDQTFPIIADNMAILIPYPKIDNSVVSSSSSTTLIESSAQLQKKIVAKIMQNSAKSIVGIKTTTKLVDVLLEEPDQALIVSDLIQGFGIYDDLKRKGTCRALTLGKFISTRNSCLFLRKNSPYTAQFNRLLLLLRQNGMAGSLEKKYASTIARQCSIHELEAQQERPMAMTVTQLFGVYLIIIGGCLVSLLVFICELLYFYCCAD
nr:EOG090X04F1 [Scapholeberis mucronata]